MDEPCSALDPRSTRGHRGADPRRCASELAIVIVTHNLQQAHRVADHVAFMYLGDLVEYGAGRAGLRRAARAAHARLRRGARSGERGRPVVARAGGRSRLRGRAAGVRRRTQEKSARRARAAKSLARRDGPARRPANPDARVLRHGRAPRRVRARPPSSRSATGARPQAAVPVGDRRARRPGARRSTATTPRASSRRSSRLRSCRRGPGAFWVNNQIPPTSAPRPRDRHGRRRPGPAAPATPRLVVSGLRSSSDSDGVFVQGVVTNRSTVEQQRLVISCVARRRRPDRRRGPRDRRPRRRRPRHQAGPLHRLLHRQPHGRAPDLRGAARRSCTEEART